MSDERIAGDEKKNRLKLVPTNGSDKDIRASEAEREELRELIESIRERKSRRQRESPDDELPPVA